jgi:AcrR family transcriptional regulator
MARVSANQRRQDFVEAAVSVIGSHGVSGATTRRIAEAADAPLATLHYCFHSKEELFLAVFQSQSDQLTDRIGVKKGIGLKRAVVSILDSTVDWYLENPNFTRAQFDLFLWATREEGNHAGLANEIYGLFAASFTSALQAALGPDDDPALPVPLANLLISTLDGLMLEWCGHQDHVRVKHELSLASEAIELLVEHRRQGPNKRGTGGRRPAGARP